MPGIYSQSTNPVSKYVEFLLRNRDKVDNFAELLAPLNVKYVILVHEVDYKLYDFLYRQGDLKVILEKPGITLLKNQHPTVRVYVVDRVVHIDSLEEYLELSKKQDVMKHLYILGSGTSNGEDTETQELDVAEKSPVRYRVSGTGMKYTVFTVPQNVNTDYWEYNGKKPALRNLGFMPAFESSPDGGEVVYTRFYHIYLPSYITSLVALSLTAWYYWGRKKDRTSRGTTNSMK